MSADNESRTGLVPSQSGALTRSGAAKLVQRGAQDLIARSEADEWLRRGLLLWPLAEIDDLICCDETITSPGPHSNKVKQAAECFRRGLQFDPNHPVLQYCLGMAHFEGPGPPFDAKGHCDPEHFLSWFRKAADQGHAMAQYFLGGWCEIGGPDDTKNYVAAVNWYRKAAEQGLAKAQFSLGNMYRSGRGVLQDYAQATSWYQKSAEQGDKDAQYRLGCAYDHGEGVAQDFVQAAFWYRRAAVQGHEEAQQFFGKAYEKAALEPDTGSNTVYFNLDNMMKLDSMLRKAGLDGLEEFSGLSPLYDSRSSG